MISENFMLTSEFYALLFLVLRVVNRYCDIFGTVSALTVSDIAIEPKSGDLPCPLIRLKLPRTFNANPEDSTDFVCDDLKVLRDYLQEYLTLIVNTNTAVIHPLLSPDGGHYSPLYVSSLNCSDSLLIVDVYFIDNPVSYHRMQRELKTRFQPELGLC